MFQCKHCGYEYTYKEALGMASSTGVGKRCPNCAKTNYFTARSRKRNVLCIYQCLCRFYFGFFDVPLTIAIPLLFAFLIGYYLAMPFCLNLAIMKNPCGDEWRIAQ